MLTPRPGRSRFAMSATAARYIAHCEDPHMIVYPGEDGYWVAECLMLPGCISQGKTREEAIQNIREAIDVYVAVLEDEE